MQSKDIFAVVEALYVMARGGVGGTPSNEHVGMRKATIQNTHWTKLGSNHLNTWFIMSSPAGTSLSRFGRG